MRVCGSQQLASNKQKRQQLPFGVWCLEFGRERQLKYGPVTETVNHTKIAGMLVTLAKSPDSLDRLGYVLLLS